MPTPESNPYGDQSGTKIGRPSSPERSGDSDSGNEAARGIHSDNMKGAERRPGSEPLKDRKNEHDSGYGGKAGNPKKSSDKR
jgi:hypothetical protein